MESFTQEGGALRAARTRSVNDGRLGMAKHGWSFLFLVSAVWLRPISARAQDLLKEALADFPRDTVRVEYSHLAKLRTLADYKTLRSRFTGSRLQSLETSLSQLGVREDDIDDLILGWQAKGAKFQFEGLASGRFDPQAIDSRATAQGIAATPVGRLTAYCFGGQPAAYCVAVTSPTRGLFGPPEWLATLGEAGQGEGSNLSSNENFVKFVNAAHTQASIWGVAVGAAVADWFQGWIASQGNNVQLDWSQAFKSVEALAYSVDTAEKVQLDMKLHCTSSAAATSLRQVFEGLKLVQQLAWQNQYPNRPNPYAALGIDASGRQVSLELITAYDDVEGIRTAGAP